MLARQDLAAIIAGVSATLVGIGLARFAYAPLLPALIEQQWLTAAEAAYVGAANLLGYLIGALIAHRLSERFAPRQVMAASFAVIVLGFLCCAQPGGFVWFMFWRLIVGVVSAVLMVVGPSVALSATPAERRPMVGALVFTGIGLGILFSATLVPLLLGVGLASTWLVLGLICLVIGVFGARSMGRLSVPAPVTAQPGNAPMAARTLPALVVGLVIAAYALDALGFVPHSLFWVDFLAREAQLGQAAASLQWGLFGLGALLGPLAAGVVARRLGWHRALTLAFAVKALAICLPLISIALFSRSLSSLLFGAMVPGIVALTSGRLAELVGPQAHKRIWGLATAAFAAAQALSGYGMSALYVLQGSYLPLFAIGSAMLVCGLGLVVLSRRLATHTS